MSIRQFSAQELMRKKTKDAANTLYQKECAAARLETMKSLTSDAAANCCLYLLTPLACLLAARGYDNADTFPGKGGEGNILEDLMITIGYTNIFKCNCKILRNVSVSAVVLHRKAFLQRNISENEEPLSGGQKQKVSIARALLKKAPIQILDEPTAALDADSEAKILNTILKLKQEGKCILLITHKASTLRVADRILYIEDGRITGQSGKR